MAKFDLITIARQFGAGGSDLALVLGKKLGWPVLDRDIIRQAAGSLKTDEASAKHLDETVETTFQTIAKGFVAAVPEAMIEPTYEVDVDELARATHRVIVAAGARAPLIVVGHGVQCLFGDRPGTLHVRVVAPLAQRAANIAARQGMDVEAATDETNRRDADRARYLRHHFGRDNNDPMLYSVQFNTAQLTVEEIAEAIACLTRR